MHPRKPDCPQCDASDTLEPERSEGRGVMVCVCSCCAAVVRVNADGAIVHAEPVTDLRGRVMTDP